jgi:hypothetical protein
LNLIYSNTVNESIFDLDKWHIQKFSFNDSWTHIVDFANMKVWAIWIIFIVVSWWTATLSFDGTGFDNCDTLTKVYWVNSSIWTTKTLAVWTHQLVLATAIEAIHIAYNWVSAQINT